MKQIVSRGHTRPLTEISFVEDDDNKTLLVSSAHDKTPQIRNGETGDWIGSFYGHKGAVWSAKVDAATRTLAASASGDFSARLWCANTGKELVELKHKHIVRSVDFGLDTLKLATGCQDGHLRIYDTCQPTETPQEIKVITTTATDGIMKLAWSKVDKDIVYIGKKSSAVEKWDIRLPSDQGAVATIALNTGHTIMDFELSHAHNVIMTASGNKVHALDLNTLEIMKSYDMPSPLTFKEEGGVTLSPDGAKFFTGGSDLWLREFDYQTGELLRTLKGHHGPVRCLRHHPRGHVVASGSEDGTIRLWDLQFQTSPSESS